jgi:hypothetical protein
VVVLRDEDVEVLVPKVELIEVIVLVVLVVLVEVDEVEVAEVPVDEVVPAAVVVLEPVFPSSLRRASLTVSWKSMEEAIVRLTARSRSEISLMHRKAMIISL